MINFISNALYAWVWMKGSRMVDIGAVLQNEGYYLHKFKENQSVENS